MARPTKLTKEVIQSITDALAIGSSYELAAVYAKISYSCLQGWMKSARDARLKRERGERLNSKEKEFLSFLGLVEDASGEAGIRWQTVVDKAAKTDPQMALQMLRIRFSGYSDNPQVQYTAPVDLNSLTNDQLQRIAAGENPADVIANPGASGAVVAKSDVPAQ